MNSTIQQFIQGQKAASLCCVDAEGHPYCWTCFFAFDAQKGLLYFKTGSASHHTPLMRQNPKLAGTILPDKLNALAIQGIQWEGLLLPAEHELAKNASLHYHKRYPFALAKPGDVYTVQLEHLEMTDNTKGFGTKIHWHRSELAKQA